LDPASIGSDPNPLFVAANSTLWNDGNPATKAYINICFTVLPQKNSDGTIQCDRNLRRPDAGATEHLVESSRDVDCLGQVIAPDSSGKAQVDQMRAFVRKMIEDTWQRYANIELAGWGDCPISTDASGYRFNSRASWKGIMIRFSHSDADAENSTDYTQVLGKDPNNATLIQYNAPAIYHGGLYDQDLGNLVHEFGHALGFEHEWKRPDWNSYSCPDGLIRSNVNLSKCIEGSNGNTGNGTPIIISDCTGSDQQNWTRLTPGGQTSITTLSVTVNKVKKCMDVSGSGTADGTKVQLWDCNGTVAQQWQQVDGRPGALVNPNSGKCLDLPNSNTTNGTQLVINPCNGGASQHWGEEASSTTLGTPPDQGSIMQYCTQGGMSAVGYLSSWDILGLQNAYGRKYTGSLVGYRGQCANIQNGSTQAGAPIIAFPCRGGSNDTWFRTNTTYEYFQAGKTSPNLCLNVQGNSVPNPIIGWGCGPGNNEKFSTVGVEWHGMGNMCVGVSKAAAGTALQLQACGGSNQKWDFWRPESKLLTSQIRLTGSNLCVASPHAPGSSVLGDQLKLQTCSTTDAKQQFAYPGGGLVNLVNGKGPTGQVCANVSGAQPVAGSNIVLWDGCWTPNTPQNNQFTLKGNIKSLSNCMTIGGVGDPYTTVSAAACSSSNTTTQLWEYYF
jgi:hypothetical protein